MTYVTFAAADAGEPLPRKAISLTRTVLPHATLINAYGACALGQT